MVRPVGTGKPLTASHRAAIARAMGENGRKLREFEPVISAAEDGDEDLAMRLLREYIQERAIQKMEQAIGDKIPRRPVPVPSPADLEEEARLIAEARAHLDSLDEQDRQADLERRGPAWQELARENRANRARRERQRAGKPGEAQRARVMDLAPQPARRLSHRERLAQEAVRAQGQEPPSEPQPRTTRRRGSA